MVRRKEPYRAPDTLDGTRTDTASPHEPELHLYERECRAAVEASASPTTTAARAPPLQQQQTVGHHPQQQLPASFGSISHVGLAAYDADFTRSVADQLTSRQIDVARRYAHAQVTCADALARGDPAARCGALRTFLTGATRLGADPQYAVHMVLVVSRAQPQLPFNLLVQQALHRMLVCDADAPHAWYAVVGECLAHSGANATTQATPLQTAQSAPVVTPKPVHSAREAAPDDTPTPISTPSSQPQSSAPPSQPTYSPDASHILQPSLATLGSSATAAAQQHHLVGSDPTVGGRGGGEVFATSATPPPPPPLTAASTAALPHPAPPGATTTPAPAGPAQFAQSPSSLTLHTLTLGGTIQSRATYCRWASASSSSSSLSHPSSRATSATSSPSSTRSSARSAASSSS